MDGHDLPSACVGRRDCFIGGRPLIVKNTFLELGDAPAERSTSSSSRSRSAPQRLCSPKALRVNHQLLQPQQVQQQPLQKERQQQEQELYRHPEHLEHHVPSQPRQQPLGKRLLSSTPQECHVVSVSLQVNCRPNLMLSPCASRSDALPVQVQGSPTLPFSPCASSPPKPRVEMGRSFSSSLDTSDAASDTSTCMQRSSSSSNSSGVSSELESHGGRTTVMIRNLPEGFSRSMLEQVLNTEGFAASYRFIYQPTDIATGSSFFYAFIDLATPEDAGRFRRHFAGFNRWPCPSPKAAAVDWSMAIQGIGQLVEKYRNSPLMHPSVPEHLRPGLYHNGQRLAFPAPTKALKAPRVRRSSSKRAQRLERLHAPAPTW